MFFPESVEKSLAFNDDFWPNSLGLSRSTRDVFLGIRKSSFHLSSHNTANFTFWDH